MNEFCIHLQPDRDPGADITAIRAACEALTHDQTLVQSFSVSEGNDKGRYVNFMFDTPSPANLWAALVARLYEEPSLGPVLKHASMAMCTGSRGWDNYLLLHHFDPSVTLDEPPSR